MEKKYWIDSVTGQIFSQGTGLATGTYQMTEASGSYGPLSQVASFIGIGLTLTDAQFTWATWGTSSSQFYQPVGKAIGGAGLAVAVASDAGGVAWGIYYDDNQQAANSAKSLLLGAIGAGSGALACGPAAVVCAAAGYSMITATGYGFTATGYKFPIFTPRVLHVVPP
jgi:hypothetical protein